MEVSNWTQVNAYMLEMPQEDQKSGHQAKRKIFHAAIECLQQTLALVSEPIFLFISGVIICFDLFFSTVFRSLIIGYYHIAEFKTPEEFFLEEDAAIFNWNSFDADTFLQTAANSHKNKAYDSGTQEMVIMVGPAASGKSTFVKKYFVPHGYVHINRDTLNTASKCIQVRLLIIIIGLFNKSNRIVKWLEFFF